MSTPMDASAPTAAQETEALERILTRLALTEDASLESLLAKLLPRILEKLATPHATVRQKTMEILAHINKRVRGHAAITLPLPALLALFNASTAPTLSLVRNFALVYTEMAFDRADGPTRAAAVPDLLCNVGRASAAHSPMLLRMALAGLEPLSDGNKAPATPEAALAAHPYLSDAAAGNRAAVLAFALDVMLFRPAPPPAPPPAPLSALQAMAAAQAAARGGGAGNAVTGAVAEAANRALAAMNALAATAVGAAPDAAPGAVAEGMAELVEEPVPPAAFQSTAPPGLSEAAAAAVAGKASPTGEVLARRKLALLNVIAAASLPARLTVLIFMAAAADTAAGVVARGEELLRKQVAYDSMKPLVDLEDAGLLDAIFALFLGSDPLPPSTPAPALAALRTPASPALRTRLLALLCRSRAAANGGARALAVLQESAVALVAPARLRAGGMEFAVWTLRNAATEVLQPMAPDLLAALTRCLDEGAPSGGWDAGAGWAEAGSANSLRGFAYTALGQLATRLPGLVATDSGAASRLFAALGAEQSGIRTAVAETSHSLCAAYAAAAPPGVRAELLQLVKTASASTSDGVRAAAARWANARDLFPFSTAAARAVSVAASGDSKLEVREEGLRGLLALPPAPPPLVATADPVAAVATAAVAARHPPLAAMLDELASAHPRLAQMAPLSDTMAVDGSLAAAQVPAATALLLPPKGFLAAITFLRDCYACERAAGAQGSVPPLYRPLLEAALVRDATPELWLASLAGLLEYAHHSPAQAAVAYVGPRLAWLRSFLVHTDVDVRELAAQLLAVAASGSSPDAAAGLLSSLAATAKQGMGAPGGAGGAPVRFEEAAGSTAAVGYLLAQAAVPAGSPLCVTLPDGAAAAAAAALYAAAWSSDDALAATAAAALGHAGLRAPLSLPVGDGAEAITAASTATRAAVAARVAMLMGHKEPKHASRAALAAGQLAAGDPWCDAVVSPLVAALMGLATAKPPPTEALLVTAGDALAMAFTGVSTAAADGLLRRGGRLAARAGFDIGVKDDDDDEEDTEDDSGDAMEEESPAAAAEAAAAAAAITAAIAAQPAARAAAQTKMLGALLGSSSLCVSPRAPERAAAAFWLLALIRAAKPVDTGVLRCHPALAARLGECQAAFSQLLSDSSDATQGAASRGLTLVYRRGDAATRRALVKGLVSTLSGEKPAAQREKVTDETEVFDKGALGEAPKSAGGGALSTYKELCAMATDVGQPDLVYRFMDLAAHAKAAQAKKGAAYGVAALARRASLAMAPHLPVLVPKLWRLQHDPTRGVAEAALAIWQALLPDQSAQKAALDAHFDACVTESLKDLGGRLWKAREAAAGALADVLQGRRWPALAPHFAACWGMSLRALDDIKESVRLQAAALARALSVLTVRVVEAGAGAGPDSPSRAEAAAALAVVLPLLLQSGVPSPAAEVRALSLKTLASLAEKAAPEALAVHLADCVAALLEALSSLEDSRLSYVQQHADAGTVGVSSAALESARVAASRGGAAGDALERLLRHAAASPEAAAEVAARLGRIANTGTGLNTRAGAARFAAQLAAPGRVTGGLPAAAASQLLQSFFNALRGEASPPVRAAYAAAAAAAARSAPSARLAAVIAECVKPIQAEESSSTAADAARGALFLRALSRDAPDALAPQLSAVLPLAFLAQHEAGPTAAHWAEVWEGNTGSASAALRLYGNDVARVAVAALDASAWPRKRAGAETIAALANGLAGAANADAMAPLAPQLARSLLTALGATARLWDGKESLLKALGALATAAPAPLLATPDAGGLAIVDAAITAAGRRNTAYRLAAMDCLAAALAAFKEADCFVRVAPLLLPACAAPPPPELTDEEKEKAAAAAADGPVPPPPIAPSLKCLAAALAGTSPATIAATGGDITAALAAALAPDRLWPTRQAALAACTTFVDRLPAASADASAWCEALLSAALSAATEPKSAAMRTAACELAAKVLAPPSPPIGAAAAAEAISALAAAVDGDANGAVRAAAQKALDAARKLGGEAMAEG